MNPQIQNSLATLITGEKLNQLFDVEVPIFAVMGFIVITYIVISSTIKLICEYKAYYKQYPHNNGDVLFNTVIILFISWSGYSALCYMMICGLSQYIPSL